MSGVGETVIGAGAMGMLSGTSDKLLSRTLRNSGTLLYSGASLRLGLATGLGVIRNERGVFRITDDGDVVISRPGIYSIVNDGQFSFSRSGIGATLVGAGIAFTNSFGAFLNSGTLDIADGYTQTAGLTVLAPGTVLAAGGGVEIQGGELLGVGTVLGDLTNAGRLEPGVAGATGTLTITGSYTQTPAGELAVKLGGTGTGMFDVLAVGGKATLDGSLNVSLVNGFQPSRGDRFPVLTFGSRAAGFTAVTGLEAFAPLTLVLFHDDSSLTLVFE